MRPINPKSVLSGAALLALACGMPAAFAENGYGQHNLVSDIQGMADHTDATLVNAWGLTRSSTGPWWVNSNGKGLSIVYDGTGAPAPAASPIVVNVPPPPGGTGSSPTGIVFNGTPSFTLASALPAVFIFATEDGTISGWNRSVDPANAVIKVNNSPAAVYKGLTMGQMNGALVLYAANFRGGTVDVFDTSFAPVTLDARAFQDPMIPAGFAPFNVQSIGGSIFVTFAQQDDTKHDDVAGPGLGYVDQFTPEGVLVRRFEHGKWLNSPWGVALAPAGFGKMSGRLLVGNFGSGQIASFDAQSGEFQGLMRGARGRPITIDGLWGLGFGNDGSAGAANVLFFAAGIQGESHGLFGTVTSTKVERGNDNDDGQGNQGQNSNGHSGKR